eukprot:gene13882-16375_t
MDNVSEKASNCAFAMLVGLASIVIPITGHLSTQHVARRIVTFMAIATKVAQPVFVTLDGAQMIVAVKSFQLSLLLAVTVNSRDGRDEKKPIALPRSYRENNVIKKPPYHPSIFLLLLVGQYQ